MSSYGLVASYQLNWRQLISGMEFEKDDDVHLTSGSVMACSCPADYRDS